jgi:5-methylcytosine-specific restriction endonuclease McrA
VTAPGTPNPARGRPSALKAEGSTKAWRKRRAEFIAQQPLPLVCGTCTLPIIDGRFDVGHVIARALGGSDDLLQIQCWPCNRGDGARLRNELRRERKGKARKPLRPNGYDVF